MTRNIYMAGKISKGDWRLALLGRHELGGQSDPFWSDPNARIEFPIIPMANGHNYTGPYFISCDHGCFHGDSQHGMGASGTGCFDSHAIDQQARRRNIYNACTTALYLFSDTVFAWVDSLDCYGTITELGIAAGRPGPAFGWKGIDIWIAGPEQYDDLWFVYQLASDTTFAYDNPESALDFFLRRHEGVDYRTYIQGDTWKATATAAKERAGWRCQVCNRPNTQVVLDAHHRTYERLGHELPEDITVLCRDCHRLYETSRKARRNGSKL